MSDDVSANSATITTTEEVEGDRDFFASLHRWGWDNNNNPPWHLEVLRYQVHGHTSNSPQEIEADVWIHTN
jgi:hypothetical protein